MATNAGGEEVDLEKIAEDELLRLQRQYRIMEMERINMSTFAKPKLKKQRELTNSLLKEYNQLILNIKISSSGSKIKRDTHIGNEMSDLLLEKEQLLKEISEEKFQISEMNFLVKQVEKEMFTLKTHQKSEKEEMENVAQNQQRVSQLENRLEVITKKFNAVNTGNFKMRQEIDHLLQERVNFNTVWIKTLNTLMSGKNLIMELVEQSTTLYDQREEWCHKLQNIRERAQYDQVEHTHEMGELQRQLDHDSKLQQFLAIKGSVRVLAEQEAREAARRRAQKDREAAVQERHRDILKLIQEFSEEIDLERLIAKFAKQEEENYALFNYVNEANHELESLANNVADLRITIEDMRAQKREREAREQESLEIMKNNLKNQQAKTEVAEKAEVEAQKQLDESLLTIKGLYDMMECGASPVLQLIGTADINIHNVMLYLKTIEKKTMDVVNSTLYEERVKKCSTETQENKDRLTTNIVPTKVKVIVKDAKKKQKNSLIDKSKLQPI